MASKTVLITGASRGIGAATAQYFVRQGWNVSATMRPAQGSASLSPQQAGDWTNVGNIICPYLDLTLPETITNAVGETVERFGRIDVLVNNAGYAPLPAPDGVAQTIYRAATDRSNRLRYAPQARIGFVSTIQI